MILPLADARWHHTMRYPGVVHHMTMLGFDPHGCLPSPSPFPPSTPHPHPHLHSQNCVVITNLSNPSQELTAHWWIVVPFDMHLCCSIFQLTYSLVFNLSSFYTKSSKVPNTPQVYFYDKRISEQLTSHQCSMDKGTAWCTSQLLDPPSPSSLWWWLAPWCPAGRWSRSQSTSGPGCSSLVLASSNYAEKINYVIKIIKFTKSCSTASTQFI